MTLFKSFGISIFSLMLLFGCTTSKKTISENGKKKKEYFLIEIEQEGKIIPQVNNTVTLKKKPFKYKVTMMGVEDIFVSASWGKFYYDFASEKNIFECNDDTFETCRFFSVKTGVQEKLNTKKQLLVGDGSYQQVWFYIESMTWHRFDEGVALEEGKVKAEMTIENIYDCDLRDKRLENSTHEYKVEEINKYIYMVFATSHYEKGMKNPEETQREKFILKFE